MNRKDYPTILDEAVIKIIASKVKADPDYLSHPECPYAASTIAVFQTTRKKALVNELDEVTQALMKLKEQLELQSDRFDAGDLVPAEANAYLKTRMSLLEKIVEMQERIRNIGEVESFFGTVMTVMEEVLEPHQATEVMDKLKNITGA